jgi:hypothetical protein
MSTINTLQIHSKFKTYSKKAFFFWPNYHMLCSFSKNKFWILYKMEPAKPKIQSISGTLILLPLWPVMFRTVTGITKFYRFWTRDSLSLVPRPCWVLLFFKDYDSWFSMLFRTVTSITIFQGLWIKILFYHFLSCAKYCLVYVTLCSYVSFTVWQDNFFTKEIFGSKYIWIFRFEGH